MTSPAWAHVCALGAVALVVVLEYGPLEHPLLGDRAYFVYLSQTMLRGESIYATSFMGYPPTALLAGAASMWLGSWLDLPTYVSPRFLGIAVAVASVALVHLVTRRALGSAGAGVAAAITLAGSAEFGALSATSLEPKSLVILLSLASALSLQRRSWWMAGLASGLAVSCWQPAAVIGLVSLAVTLWEGRGRWRSPLASYALGALAGLLPALVYLAWMDAWSDFFGRFLGQAAVTHAASGPLRWVEIIHRYYANELVLFVAAAVGFLGFVVDSLRRRDREVREAWLGARLGGLPLLTASWLVYDSFDFQGLSDVLPLLPVTAFWLGWLWSRVTPRLGGLARVALYAALSVYAFADAFLYRPTLTLDRQRAIVEGIVRPAGPEGVVVGFSADELFALAERPSPLPFLRLDQPFEALLPLVEPGGCPAVEARVLGLRPAVVVSRDWAWKGDCVRRIEQALQRRGYRMRRVPLSARQWQDRYVPDDTHVYSRTWNVFVRRRGGGARASRPGP